MEDFHSHSVLMSHSVARNNAWCPSDSYTQNIRSIGMEAEGWPPEDWSDNYAASDAHSGHFSPVHSP